MRRWLSTFAVTLVVAGLFSTRAADAGPSPSPSPSATPKVLNTMVVTAQRRPTPLGSTSREVFVVSANDLRRLGAQTVGDALRFVGGAAVQSYGPPGSLETVMLRGASAEQTLVLLDGRPINEPDTGDVDFSSVPLDAVARIEVVEGGASTLYGSAAVGGVINIITSPATLDRIYTEAGYAGAFASGLSASAGDGRTLQTAFAIRHARAQNVFAYPAFVGEPAGVRTNDDTDVQDSTLSLRKTLGAIDVVTRFEDDDSVIGAPGSVAFGASGLARQQRYIRRSGLDLVWPNAGGTWAADFYADDRRLHFYDATPPFPFDSLIHATTRGFGIRHSGELTRSDMLTLGYDARGDRAAFSASFDSPPTSLAADSSTAWYMEIEHQPPGSPFTLSAGIRDEHAQGTAAGAVPSFGVAWRLAGEAVIRANYARAFRAPTLDERYFPGFGNPALAPEYAATSDVGITKDFGGASASLTLFGADTNNLIVDEVIDAFGDVEPFNIARSRVRGYTLDLRARIGSGSELHAVHTGYPEARDLTLRTRLLYRPTATSSLEFSHAASRMQFGGQLWVVGRRFADEQNTQPMPAYVSLGVFVTQRLTPNLSLTMRADNLFRGQAEDQLGFPVNKETLSVRLEAQR